MLGCVDREHRLLEHRADRGRQGEPAVAQPVPVVGDGEPAGLLGEGLLALQGPELVGFGDLGGDHLEDPVREPAQRDRVVLGRPADQVGLGVAAVLDRQRVDTLDDHHGLLLGDLRRRPSRPGPARGRGPGRARGRGVVWRRVWSAGWCWPSGCRCRWRRGSAPRSRRSAWWACAELELGDPVPQRGQGGQVGRRSRRPGGSTARGPRARRSSLETAAIMDVTGCCPVSSNTVVIQGILASTTDNPGPRIGAHSGQLWTKYLRKCLLERRRMSGSRHASPAGQARGSTIGSAFRPRALRCSTTETAASASSTTAVPDPGADRHPAPYLSPSLRLSPPAPATAREWSRHSLDWRSLLDHRRHHGLVSGQRPRATRMRLLEPQAHQLV